MFKKFDLCLVGSIICVTVIGYASWILSGLVVLGPGNEWVRPYIWTVFMVLLTLIFFAVSAVGALTIGFLVGNVQLYLSEIRSGKRILKWKEKK